MNAYTKIRTLYAVQRVCRLCSKMLAIWPLWMAIIYMTQPVVPHVNVNGILTQKGRVCKYLGSKGIIAFDFFHDCPHLVMINIQHR